MTEKGVAVVTGGAGFIGSHMVDVLLAHGYSVRVIDNLTGGRKSNLAHLDGRRDVECIWQDIRTLDPQSLVFQGARFVFHFAGIGDIVPSIENPTEYMDVNVQGTVRVLECARAANVEKFVYASSSSCYGLAATPTDESHPIAPQYPYALSKYLGEVAAFHWHLVYGLPVNAICIFNAYGPRVRTTGVYGAVFGVFFRQKLAGKPYTVVGDGSQTRDFIYVTDIAEAFLAAAETEVSGERFNVGADKPQAINRLVDILGGDVVYVPKRPGEPDCTWANIKKIKTQLGWKPTVAFEDGVKIMLADIELWRDAPLWEPASIAKATQTWFRYLGEKKRLMAE
jgi:UDP-glucose 4-epimerase